MRPLLRNVVMAALVVAAFLNLPAAFAVQTKPSASQDVDAVRVAVKQFAAAAREGDAEQVVRLSDVGDAEPQRSMLFMLAGVTHLRSACEKHFGTPPGNIMGTLPSDAEAEAAKIQVNGDTAAVTVKGGRKTTFRRVDGRWLFALRDQKFNMGNNTPEVFRRIGSRASDLARGVAEGKFETLEEVEVALDEILEEERK